MGIYELKITCFICNFSLTKQIYYDIINNRQEFANMAQSAEHILGKDEVPGSNPGISSRYIYTIKDTAFVVSLKV